MAKTVSFASRSQVFSRSGPIIIQGKISTVKDLNKPKIQNFWENKIYGSK